MALRTWRPNGRRWRVAPRFAGAGVAFKLAWRVARTIGGASRVDERMRSFLLEAHVLAEQRALYHRAGCSRAARRGEYNAAMERT